MDATQLVAAERADLAALLRTLRDEEWLTPSLCDGWLVRDVVGHLTVNGSASPLDVLGTAIRSGLSGDRTNSALAARARAWSTAELIDRFLAVRATGITNRTPRLALADMVVHHQDIRRPLNRPREIPLDRLRAVLDNPNPGSRPKRRMRGLRFVASDVDWSTGGGPEVLGTGEAIMLAIAGRSVALDELTGAGVAELRRRTRPAQP